MSLITERVQKAIRRSEALDLAAIRAVAAGKFPAQLADVGGLEERRRFLLQTSGSAATAGAAYERILHGNELQDVNYLARGTRAARSIGRISIREPNGRLSGYGTGFLIGSGVLLTNNHVLRAAEWAARSEVEFDYERDEAGRQRPGVKFSLEPGRLFLTHEALDFSVVAVAASAVNAERALNEFGSLPLIGGTGKAVEGEWLTIIQHPGGELKQVCVRENRLLQKGADVLWYSTDTLGGSSGSPVFNNDWLVVALHHSGVPEIKNGRWQTIDGQDFDERLHREEDIKWVANEGIRVSRIVQTLRESAGNHPLIRAALDFSPGEHFPNSNQTTHTPPVAMTTPMLPMQPTTSLANRKYLIAFDAVGNPTMTTCAESPTVESLSAERAARGRRQPEPRGVSFRFDSDYEKREGFEEDFLGKHKVHLPKLKRALELNAVKLLEPEGTKDYVLKYTNMSLVMHAKRRFAIYTAANVDFARRYAGLKSKRVWKYDPRIPLESQIGEEGYEHNQFDKGHLTRQEDMEYGDSIQDALQSTADTCHWTNCVPQHQWFNRTQNWWQGLEQHILEYAIDPRKGKGFRAQVFTGPVFAGNDPEYDELPDIKVPMKFWKVAVAVTSSDKLFAVAYLLDQSPVIKKYGVAEAAGEMPFEPFKLFQLPIAELEGMIHMKFTCTSGTRGTDGAEPLSTYDPLNDGTPPELDSDQDGDDDRLESTGGPAESTPKNWVNLLRRRPYFG